MAVSYIGGGNWSTQRKPWNCRKSLINLSHKVVSSTPRLNVVRTHNISGEKALIAQIVGNPTTIRSPWPLHHEHDHAIYTIYNVMYIEFV